jgi:hypothetical protein
MLLNSASLATTVADLRAGRLDLHQYIDRQCDLIDRIDGRIAALLPEDNRRERLHREAEALLAADPLRTLPLFGALTGVKDIFHVDGFVTRAGATVPPELFAGPEAVVPVTQSGRCADPGQNGYNGVRLFEPARLATPIISIIRRAAQAAARRLPWRRGLCRWQWVHRPLAP